MEWIVVGLVAKVSVRKRTSSSLKGSLGEDRSRFANPSTFQSRD